MSAQFNWTETKQSSFFFQNICIRCLTFPKSVMSIQDELCNKTIPLYIVTRVSLRDRALCKNQGKDIFLLRVQLWYISAPFCLFVCLFLFLLVCIWRFSLRCNNRGLNFIIHFAQIHKWTLCESTYIRNAGKNVIKSTTAKQQVSAIISVRS